MEIIPKKILVAEDDKLISKAFKMGLEKAGFLVVVALDGQAAIEKIKKEKPDIIILDLVMPIKDGFKVLAEVRADKILKTTPVVVLTNLEGDCEIQKAKEMGVNDYLLKTNFTIDDVIPIINGYLE